MATIYLVWGSTYLAIRLMVDTIPPALGAGLRFVVAGAILYAALGLRRGLAGLRVTRGEAASAALIGCLLCAGGNGLVSVAERSVPSGIAALLVASIPLWVVLMRAGAGERIGARTLAGVALGFGGVALLLLPGGVSGAIDPEGAGLLLLAAVLWATGTFLSPRLTLPGDPLVSVAVQMTAGGLLMTLAGVAAGEPGRVHLDAISTSSALGLLYLVVVGSLLAYTAFAWLLQNVPLSTVTTYAYVNPVIAVALGWAFLSEAVTATTLAGAALIVVAVALTLRQAPPAAPPDQRAPLEPVEPGAVAQSGEPQAA